MPLSQKALDEIGPKPKLCMSCAKNPPLPEPVYFGHATRGFIGENAWRNTESTHRWACRSCADREFREWAAGQGLMP